MKSTSNATDNPAIKAAANAWWVRLDSDTVSARERVEFADWLDADPQHRQAFDAVCALWDELDAVKQRIVKPEIIAPKTPWFRRLWAAPTLTMCCLALWLFSPLPMLLRADFHTGYGEMRDIRLSDGSIVHLNSHSALSVHIDGNQRQLTLLQGEAWFEVSPDSTRPFQVHAEHGTVTALGTAFNIRLRNSQAEVSVTQHSVAIDVEQTEGRGLHAVVNEGQQLVYDQQTGLGRIKAIDSQTVTAWQRGKLVFENQPLGEVMAELNRYHRGYLVSDDSITQRRVNGVFRTDQPLAVIDALESSLSVHSTRINDYLILLHR
ncbi:FecR family protein [Methylobacter sp. G7]|uniref:FecR family protein n=1 Tax=Methylobacter sp. G7 TaxID=3230117 RepID=UPI003D8095D5